MTLKLSEAIQITLEDSNYEHHILLVHAAKHYIDTRRRLKRLYGLYSAADDLLRMGDLAEILKRMPAYEK